MHMTTNFFEMKTDQSDWPRLHPLYASVADPERYSLMREVAASKKTNDATTTWYHVFIQYMLPCGTGSFLDTTLDESQVREACVDSSFYRSATTTPLYNPRCADDDALMSPGYFCGPRSPLGNFTAAEHLLADVKAVEFASQDPTSVTALSSPDIPVCSAWPVQYFRCGGEECFGPAELQQGLYDQIQRNETIVLGIHPDYFYPCLDYFLNADNAYVFRTPNFNCVNPTKQSEYVPCTAIDIGSRAIWRGGGPKNDGDMDHTSVVVWSTNLEEGKNWLRLISSLRSHINNFVSNTKLRAYPGSNFWVFWYQYRFIQDTVTDATAVGICGIFLIAFVFFMFAHPPQETTFPVRVLEAAMVSLYMVAAVILTVLTFIALMGIADLWFNAFTLAPIIISLGVAVEFVAHTSTGYLVSIGTAPQRARHAAAAYVLPILDGGFTTFIGVAPLAASVLLYVNLYYFQLYAIMITVGLAFGVLIYPALLATFGRSNLTDMAFADAQAAKAKKEIELTKASDPDADSDKPLASADL